MMAEFFSQGPSSVEWLIDSRLEELAGKLLHGDATEAERQEHRDLSALRARQMKPNERVNIARVRERLRRHAY